MKNTVFRFSGVLCLLAGVAACASPSKPSVTLTSPRLVTPAMGAQIANAAQPVTLTIQNATTTGTAPLTYTFEVATDDQFTNVVYTKSGVAPGSDGTTSVQIDTLPAGKGYYWRAHADNGTSAGPATSALNFAIGPAITIAAPALASPGVGATVSTVRPTLTVTDSTTTGPVGALVYKFEISTSSTFDTLVVSGTAAQQSGQTSYTPTQDLQTDVTYYWRVVATDTTNSISSSYSSTGNFKTSLGIDLSQVVYVLGPNISKWPQTSTITNAYADGSNLCIYHTKLGIWPATTYTYDPSGNTTVEGNQWVFAKINGTWYGGAADWYRPGQACKGVTAQSIGGDAFYQPQWEPLRSWVPHSGEVFGVASTTPARAWPSMSTLDERTDVKLIVWP
ncbi:MAG TPA: hypothetical protein VND92_11395 [Vicinamibacterales bacterium]|nr:hypothetical protein [Vicinamibacterales bacterium]